MSRRHWIWLFAGLACLFPATAYADVVIPTLVYEWPLMLLTLAPVVAIEYALFLRWLPTRWPRLLLASITANIASTLVGVPLAWLFAWLVSMLLGLFGKLLGIHEVSEPWSTILNIIVGSSVLGPSGVHNWMIPLSILVWLVPCFYLSVYVEQLIVRRFLRDVEPNAVRKATWGANAYSYLILVALCVVAFVAAVF